MSAEQNAEVVRQSIEAVFRGNWDRLWNSYAEDAIMVGTPEPLCGNEAIVKLFQGCHEEEHDIQGEIINIISQGDMVAVEWRHRGIVGQVLPGMPESVLGKHVEATEVYICKVRDGKIVSTTIYGGDCKIT